MAGCLPIQIQQTTMIGKTTITHQQSNTAISRKYEPKEPPICCSRNRILAKPAINRAKRIRMQPPTNEKQSNTAINRKYEPKVPPICCSRNRILAKPAINRKYPNSNATTNQLKTIQYSNQPKVPPICCSRNRILAKSAINQKYPNSNATTNQQETIEYSNQPKVRTKSTTNLLQPKSYIGQASNQPNVPNWNATTNQ
jgi:hypothetical protein